MTADTVFDLASLTKVVATLPSVLRLVGRGEVGLDEPVRPVPARRLDGPGKDQVTVRQLLLHTSGLAGRAEVLPVAAATRPRSGPPRSPSRWWRRRARSFCYSDVGFITLGELAAAVAGCRAGRVRAGRGVRARWA